jgi:transcriptional antiterminator RfaH
VKQWFAVKAKPRRESQACAFLAQRGIEAYLPRVPSRGRPGGEAPLESLFPGYLFSRLALGTSDWLTARSAPGVAYFLGPQGVPSPLPDELVERIRAGAEGTRRRGWEAHFRRGDRVLIERGAFAGLEAVFDGVLSANGRVRVFLEVVSRTLTVNLDVGLLSPRRLGTRDDAPVGVGRRPRIAQAQLAS